MFSKNPFEEYLREADPSKQERIFAWRTAIGLQAVDGLKVSDYLMEIAVKHINGEITIYEAQKLIDDYYQNIKAKQDSNVVKQDYEIVKQDSVTTKQDFNRLVAAGISVRSAKNALILLHKFGYIRSFGRMDVARTLNITKSPASELLKKLHVAGVIHPYGQERGKYQFDMEFFR